MNWRRDKIVPLGRDAKSIPVSQIFRLYLSKEYDGDDIPQVRQGLTLRALPESWKEYFQGRLDRQGP